MRVEMKQWEIERVKEIVSKLLEFYIYEFIEANDGNGRSISMSTKTFLEQLERELKNSHG